MGQPVGQVFGGIGQSGEGRLTDYYKDHCPLHQFTSENKDKYSSVHWFLTCGDDEQQLLFANDDLHVMMRDNGYDHEYRVGNGGHSTSYWRAAMEEFLPWFSSLMKGETSWQKAPVEVNVPDDCTFDSEGVYVSEAYASAGTKSGVGLYIAYEGIPIEWVRDAMAIIQRGMSAKKFVLFPCDMSRMNINEWINFYRDFYPTETCQALAIGTAGGDVLKKQSLFDALYFENADISGEINVLSDKSYFIGASDCSAAYRTANALYKACKSSDVTFEYRCRNSMDDALTDFLTGIEIIKSNLYNF